MSTMMEGVEVKLGRLDEDWRKFAIIVQVHSRVKPGLKATTQIDPGKVSTQAALLKLVGVAGGAGAEYLGNKYGDNIDPNAAVMYAQRAFLEEMKLVSELSKDVPAKLKRLWEHQSELSNSEQELLTRCQRIVYKQDHLTVSEVKALDAMIAKVHNAQL